MSRTSLCVIRNEYKALNFTQTLTSTDIRNTQGDKIFFVVGSGLFSVMNDLKLEHKCIVTYPVNGFHLATVN